MDYKDYYKILGVHPNASLELIKSSYRKLSKKFHPDVNNGDKFFEDRFKEIQEAYENLSDATKRNIYDTKYSNYRNSFKPNFQMFEENLRKKEESLKKQQEDFKKWEESLKMKEEKLNGKEKAKYIRSKLLIFSLFTISIISIFYLINQRSNNGLFKPQSEFSDTNYNHQVADIEKPSKVHNSILKSSVVATKLLYGNIFQQDSKGDWYLIEKSLNGQNKELVSETMINIFKESDIATTLDGTWKGSAYQIDINETWEMKIKFNSREGIFQIEYPSLGCSGNLTLEVIKKDEVQFRESIQNNTRNCTNNGKLIIKVLNKSELAYYYYLANSDEINAKGTLLK